MPRRGYEPHASRRKPRNLAGHGADQQVSPLIGMEVYKGFEPPMSIATLHDPSTPYKPWASTRRLVSACNLRSWTIYTLAATRGFEPRTGSQLRQTPHSVPLGPSPRCIRAGLAWTSVSVMWPCAQTASVTSRPARGRLDSREWYDPGAITKAVCSPMSGSKTIECLYSPAESAAA